MIHIVNKHTHSPNENDIYVGRGSKLGNPFSSIQGRETKANFICASREEAIENFSSYLKQKISDKDKNICDELNRIWKIAKSVRDINLVCYCAPKSCHATIIKRIVEDKL